VRRECRPYQGRCFDAKRRQTQLFADSDRASVNPGEQTVERAPNREALPRSMHAIHD
jgi:hypothetical protein